MKLFENAPDKSIIVDASASYLSDPDAPKLIHEVSPEAKILVSLRNPIERAYSAYLMHWSRAIIKKTFLDEISYELTHEIDLSKPNIRLPAGFYYEDVKRYLEIFGKNNVKIIIFEEWIKDPKKTIEEILKFINLNYNLNNFHYDIFNRFYVPKGEFSEKPENFQELLTIGLLNNNAKIGKDIIGDPTEAALIVSAKKAGIDTDAVIHDMPRVQEIEFSSERKMMTTIHKKSNKRVAYCKGATEEILDRCEFMMLDGKKVRMGRNEKQQVINQIQAMTPQQKQYILQTLQQPNAMKADKKK